MRLPLALLASLQAMGIIPRLMRSAHNGNYSAPPYCQRKARKLARQTGIHPANPKRRA